MKKFLKSLFNFLTIKDNQKSILGSRKYGKNINNAIVPEKSILSTKFINYKEG